MVDALFHLQAAHPNIAGWYHSTPAAQVAFKAGDINRLLQLELEYVERAQHVSTDNQPHPGAVLRRPR
ncbi:MAG: hypothetical protein WKF76_09475 [Nocardioidaceae bacterium]